MQEKKISAVCGNENVDHFAVCCTRRKRAKVEPFLAQNSACILLYVGAVRRAVNEPFFFFFTGFTLRNLYVSMVFHTSAGPCARNFNDDLLI